MEDQGLKVVLEITAAYVASVAGMLFAWYHYRKRQREGFAVRAQADHAASLAPVGDPMLGLLIPPVALPASIAVSVLLYWRVARRPRGS